MSNHIFCLIGPSGSGKSSIAKALPYEKVKCYTTRDIRKGEIDGEEKFFVSEDFFLKHVYPDAIAHTRYAGKFYGITQGEILGLEDGPLIYVVDINGANGLKKVLPTLEGYEDVQVVTIFLEVPKADLEMRMIAQGRSDIEIQTRLHRYKKDNRQKENCDYIIQNKHNQMDETIKEIQKIIDLCIKDR